MSIQCVRYCKVLSIKDDTDSDLIQVRIEPEDNGIKNDKKLPYAYPLLPKAFHVKPKVGEYHKTKNCGMMIINMLQHL